MQHLIIFNFPRAFQLPLVDVSTAEIDAVLSYLAMEIGWYYYHHEYTQKDERSIEELRIQRRKKPVKSHSVAPASEKNIPDVPVKEDKKKPVKAKQEPKENPLLSDKKRIAKGKIRWDKTEDE